MITLLPVIPGFTELSLVALGRRVKGKSPGTQTVTVNFQTDRTKGTKSAYFMGKLMDDQSSTKQLDLGPGACHRTVTTRDDVIFINVDVVKYRRQHNRHSGLSRVQTKGQLSIWTLDVARVTRENP